MRLLAIDTALEACSVGFFDFGAADASVVRSAPMVRGHAEALVPMMAEVAAAIGGFGDLDRIAVTVGPGSFTGIRVGVSAARALALATGLPVVGVSTLAAIAAPLLESADLAVAAALDARHERVFFHLFAPGGRSMVGPRCVGVREAARAAGIGPILAVGSGAALLCSAGEAMGIEFRAAGAEAALPDIGWVAQIGAIADADANPARPMYLRPADAKPQLNRIARQ